MKEGRFGIFEGITLLLFVTLGKIYLSYASDLIEENLSAAWIVVFLGSLVAMAWFIPLAALLLRFPGEDLIGIGEKLLGPVGGALLVGPILFFIFASSVIVLRQVGETIIGTALPQAPLPVVLIVLAFIAALTARLGVPSAVCVNKWDINPATTERIRTFVHSKGLAFAGLVRYDRAVTEAQRAQRAIPEFCENELTRDIRRVWDFVTAGNR